MKSFYNKIESYWQYSTFLSWLKSQNISPLLSISRLRQRLNEELLETKSKVIIYSTDISDYRYFKDLKSETLQLSIEPESHISGTIKNIIRDKLATLSHQSLYPEDQIFQLTQKTLNLIGQAVNSAVTKLLKGAVNKTLDQNFGQDCRQPVIAFQNPTQYNIWDMISKKNWRPKEIGFFNPDCEKLGSVATINCYIYYWDVYAFIDQLKDIALSQSIEKTRAILPQLLLESALI